jgi:hypothetical protein
MKLLFLVSVAEVGATTEVVGAVNIVRSNDA